MPCGGQGPADSEGRVAGNRHGDPSIPIKGAGARMYNSEEYQEPVQIRFVVSTAELIAIKGRF